MTDADDEPLPLCPKCEMPMRLNRVSPRFGGNPELRTYVCQSCREALTFSDDDEVDLPVRGAKPLLLLASSRHAAISAVRQLLGVNQTPR